MKITPPSDALVIQVRAATHGWRVLYRDNDADTMRTRFAWRRENPGEGEVYRLLSPSGAVLDTTEPT